MRESPVHDMNLETSDTLTDIFKLEVNLSVHTWILRSQLEDTWYSQPTGLTEEVKSREITPDIRKIIMKSGSSLRTITRCLKVPCSSDHTIMDKLRHDENVQPSHHAGRRQVLCPRDERVLV